MAFKFGAKLNCFTMYVLNYRNVNPSLPSTLNAVFRICGHTMFNTLSAEPYTLGIVIAVTSIIVEFMARPLALF